MSIKADIAYVVQSEDGRVVKVGISGNPRVRIYGIKQALPFPVRLVALVADGRASERQMKEILAPWRLQGEWFEPRPELNEFLAEMRRQNKLLKAATVDEEYSDRFIKPAVLEYLSGRKPTMSEAGDMVYRYLHEGLEVIAHRMDDLHSAVARAIPASVLAGFVPLAQGEQTPLIEVPPVSEIDSADASPKRTSRREDA